MSKKKSDRGHVSVNGPLYARLRAHCRKQGVSMSARVELLLADLPVDHTPFDERARIVKR